MLALMLLNRLNQRIVLHQLATVFFGELIEGPHPPRGRPDVERHLLPLAGVLRKHRRNGNDPIERDGAHQLLGELVDVSRVLEFVHRGLVTRLRRALEGQEPGHAGLLCCRGQRQRRGRVSPGACQHLPPTRHGAHSGFADKRYPAAGLRWRKFLGFFERAFRNCARAHCPGSTRKLVTIASRVTIGIAGRILTAYALGKELQ